MLPSTNPLWKPDADGFDARRILYPLGAVMITLVLAAEIYFALTLPRYDLRTGGLQFLAIGLASRIAFPGPYDGGPRWGGARGWSARLLA